MKKIITTIAAIVLSALIGLTTLAGCNIVTTDTERDMAQVVATVNIGNEGGKTETIYKKDLTMAYMSYGYYYVYYQGYTNAQVFEMIIDNLVNNRILIQNAMKEFEEKDMIEDSSIEKWELDRYLSKDEITEAVYDVNKGINELIDGYETDDSVKNGDTLTEEVRTVPTDAANDTEVEFDEKKSDTEYTEILSGENDIERKKAYNKVLKLLQSNGLLGEDFKSDLSESQYYKDLLKSQKEATLLEKYDKYISKVIRSKVTFSDLEAKYAEMYEAQKTGYTANKTNFESAISSYSAKSPIVYSPFSGYGFVYNLLLGASAEQTEAINALKAKETNVEKFQEGRKKILESTTAKDLRSTWILSGYDFDYVDDADKTGTFSGDYTFFPKEEDASKRLPFKGKVNKFEAKNEKEADEYGIESIYEYGLAEFVEMMDTYVYGAPNTETNSSNVIYKKTTTLTTKPDDYDKKINELLFAFSTDPGSLNTYKGYSIAPKPDNAGQETYVQEFADAARELVENGGANYVIVATDYGYHVMFFSEVLDINVDYATLSEYLNVLKGLAKDDSTTDWSAEYASILNNYEDADEDDYLYILSGLCSNVDTALNNKKNDIVKKYKNDTNYVTYNEKAYADLLELD